MSSDVIDFKDWERTAIERFGAHPGGWKFQCPSCGNVQSMKAFKDLGVDPNLAYADCIGRYDGQHGHVDMGTKPGPCNYSGSGLFKLNPISVRHPETGAIVHVFEFAS